MSIVAHRSDKKNKCMLGSNATFEIYGVLRDPIIIIIIKNVCLH